MAFQTMTIAADFTCCFSFGIQPTFTDYYIEVPVNNNGHEPPILLARRQPNITMSSPTDQFTVEVSLFHISRRSSLQLCFFFFQIPFAPYVAGAGYSVVLDNTFSSNGTNGTPFLEVGGIEAGITINIS